MKKYIGVKMVIAEPMTAGEAYKQGHRVTKDGEQDMPGYEVEYEDGYNSWSPKDVFEAAYRQTDGLTFGLAIEALKRGMKVERAGWNGRGMYLQLAVAGTSTLHVPANHQAYPVEKTLPHIVMRTVQGEFVPWLASQTDMLVEDWAIVVQGATSDEVHPRENMK